MNIWKKSLSLASIISIIALGMGCSNNHQGHHMQGDHKEHTNASQPQASNHGGSSMMEKPFKPTATIGKSVVKDFTYTNQDGKKVSQKDLKGKVWVADFIFTRCTHVCPMTMPIKVKLDEKLRAEGLDVQFVSFSVEPDRDTPDVLKAYAKKYKDDLKKSQYLTGYNFQQIKEFAKDSFGQELVQKEQGVSHGRSFYIIDASGKVVQEFDGTKPQYDQMMQAIKSIISK